MEFSQEIKEFIENYYIQEFKIIKNIDSVCSECTILTLENCRINFIWSKVDGIKIEEIENSEVEEEERKEGLESVYESIEQILQKFSPAYVSKFHYDLYRKLQKIASDQ
jgi:hypothetical protein